MPCFPLVAPTTTHSFLLLGPIFANLGLVSCHLSYCLNLASRLASRALAAHAHALLCPTLNAHATRTHVPTCLVLARCCMRCTLLRPLSLHSPALVPQHAAAPQPTCQTCLAFMLATSAPMLLPRLGTRPQAKPWQSAHAA